MLKFPIIFIICGCAQQMLNGRGLSQPLSQPTAGVPEELDILINTFSYDSYWYACVRVCMYAVRLV